MSSKPLFLNITVEKDDAKKGLFQILSEVKPYWERQEIEFKTFSEGFVNEMALCHLKSDTETVDGVVLRTHGEQVKDLLDRNREFIGLQVADAAGVGPHILAVFNNGLCYSYLPGRTMNYSDYHDDKIMKSLASSLAKLVAVDASSLDIFDLKGDRIVLEKRNTFFNVFDSLVNNTQPYESIADADKRQRVIAELPALEILQSDYKKWKEKIMSLDFMMAFCHNDMHMKNVIYNEKDDSLNFVDYEMSGYGYPSAELGRIVGSSAKQIMVIMGLASESDQEFTIDHFSTFLRNFLSELHFIQRKTREVSELDLKRIVLEAQIVQQVLSVVTVLFALTSVQNPIVKMDTFKFMFIALEEYKRSKEQLPAMFAEYSKLRTQIDGNQMPMFAEYSKLRTQTHGK